jgi:predicted Zn-ribbon and HTH transcriptional regulator
VTQSTIEIVDQFTHDLDSLDTSMDKVYAHFVFPQQGMDSEVEIMALPTVKALCGYAFAPKVFFPNGSASTCPKCIAIWKE